LNQFGGSVGGPLAKDKLFFYTGLEILKQRTSSPFVESTPSATVLGFPTAPRGRASKPRPLVSIRPCGPC
jgi:hypothetical protein